MSVLVEEEEYLGPILRVKKKSMGCCNGKLQWEAVLKLYWEGYCSQLSLVSSHNEPNEKDD